MPAKANSDRTDLENLLAQVYELEKARRKVNERTLEDEQKTESKAPRAA
jgi:hypothetical protein